MLTLASCGYDCPAAAHGARRRKCGESGAARASAAYARADAKRPGRRRRPSRAAAGRLEQPRNDPRARARGANPCSGAGPGRVGEEGEQEEEEERAGSTKGRLTSCPLLPERSPKEAHSTARGYLTAVASQATNCSPACAAPSSEGTHHGPRRDWGRQLR
ncbi:unnamed protein product [Prorocentrum cordatum]|uniref:Uncharacterized protein n=1 Tax=Prorocentrum cordatum TaxID=2364126 RepID=A0ABN9VZY4_9DINO|nr:unnamed protein product [Polarella glacialis]